MSVAWIRSSADIGSGVLIAAIGAAGLWMVRDLDMGTVDAMGPAYMPTLLAILLVAFGVMLIGRGMILEGPRIAAMRAGPIGFVTAAFLLFGLTVERIGLVAAVMLLVVVASLGCSERSWRETLVFGGALAALASLVFVWGLNVPVRVFP